jgi:hypothetical protein
MSKKKNFNDYLLSDSAQDREAFLEACRIVIYNKQRRFKDTKINNEDTEIVRSVKYNQIKKSSYTNIHNDLINPYTLSNSDLQQAQSIKDAIVYTKKRISKELGIKLENILYVPQTKFHIDMELFVSPKGTVFINDHELTKKNIYNISRKPEYQDSYEFLKDNYLYEKDKALRLNSVTNNLEEILKSAGKKVFRISGSHEGFKYNNSFRLNFFNGFFVKENGNYIYITTGGDPRIPLIQYLEKQFRDTILSCAPEVSDVRFINSSKTLAYLHLSGGYNCRTFQGFGIVPEKLNIVGKK